MIKGLAITPPIIGRISIGKVVERNGKRLPEKDDAFTITTLVQNKDGWLQHPLHQKLQEAAGKEKLRAIPVTVLFNANDLNLRAEYSLFERETGRPVCVGNGETAKGVTAEGMKEYPCPTPAACGLGRKGGCKPYGRLNVQIEGQGDEFGSFIFRTTGFNSIRTLSARLAYFDAVSGGLTRYLPLTLKLRGKSTTQSHRAPIYFVDLCLRDGVVLADVVKAAKEAATRDQEAGIDVAALERSARTAIANGAFEENEEDLPGIVEEFFGAESEVAGESGDGMALPDHKAKPSLAEKLERKSGMVEHQALGE